MKKLFILFTVILALYGTSTAQKFKSESAGRAIEQLDKGNVEGAIEILDKAIGRQKDLLESYQLRGNINAMIGNLTGAITDYTSALEIDPTHGKIYESRAYYRAFRRDWAGALKDYDSAVANGIKTDRIYLRRGEIKRDMDDIDGAIADLQTSISLNPDLAGAYHGLAILMESKGDVHSAMVLLQDFLDRNESKDGGKLPVAEGSVTASINIKRRGQEKDGKQVYMIGTTRTSNESTSSPQSPDDAAEKMEQTLNISMAYFTLGRLYAKKDDLDNALLNYGKGLKISKDDPVGYKLRSEVHMKKSDLAGTIADLKSIVDSPMHLPDNHRDRGVLLLLQGKDEEAKAEFDLHLLRFPKAVDTLNKTIEEAKRLLKAQQPN